ncbi:hypothetical protein F5884DRAFT_455590 [Xylogone sp. PMI_703]|nr:hypothetical protein F5884DRAFT_455590 [Xylogone sp. PMI_703]
MGEFHLLFFRIPALGLSFGALYTRNLCVYVFHSFVSVSELWIVYLSAFLFFSALRPRNEATEKRPGIKYRRDAARYCRYKSQYKNFWKIVIMYGNVGERSIKLKVIAISARLYFCFR